MLKHIKPIMRFKKFFNTIKTILSWNQFVLTIYPPFEICLTT